MDNKAINVSALTKKARKCQQFLNFIRQNWIAIALNIAAVVICAWSFRYGLSRSFDLDISSVIMALGIIVIASPIVDMRASTPKMSITCMMMVGMAGAIAGAILCFTQGASTLGNITGVVVGFIFGAIISFVLGGGFSFLVNSIVDNLWEQHKKYCLPIVLGIMTFTVLLASSFQNVGDQFWKFDRGTGKLVERTVFILPGSTLEKEYFVVERKPQKEVFVWIWFPPVKDSGWSYEKEGYTFRHKVILTCNFKNHKAYERIQGTQFPDLPILADSRAQGPEAVKKVILMTSGLTSEDIEITKIDGLE